MKIVKLEMTDGSKPKWAILLEDGSYCGQVWNGMTKTYPAWKTKRAAEAALKKLKAEAKDE